MNVTLKLHNHNLILLRNVSKKFITLHHLKSFIKLVDGFVRKTPLENSKRYKLHNKKYIDISSITYKTIR